jgi:hypothetical protein
MRSSAWSQLKIRKIYRKETHTHPWTPNVARPTGPKDGWLHLLNLAFAQHITNRVREWHTPNELNDKDKNCNRQSNFADESSNSIQSNLQQKTHNMNQSCHIYSTRVLASNWGKNTQMETKSESAVQSQNWSLLGEVSLLHCHDWLLPWLGPIQCVCQRQ